MLQPSQGSFKANPNQNKNSLPWSSIWQLILSILGILVFWGLSILLILLNLGSIVNTFGEPSASVALLLMVASFAFIGILLIPSAILSSIRLFNIQKTIPIRLPRLGLLFSIFTMLLVSGYLVSQRPSLALILLPPIHVVAIGIAALWMILLGIRGLSIGSNQRLWGIFNLGLVAAPILSLLVEFLVVVGMGFILIAYLGREPGFSAELSQLYQNYLSNPNFSLDSLMESLEPYLIQPVVVYAVLVVVAFLIPLIEEFIKPIGVWLLASKKPTPSQGFIAGVLSGGGFALFENLTLSATSGEGWALVVASRIGTSIIHIITTGITGWALASAWSQKKYPRLFASYFIAVAIHALWNGLVVLSIVPVFLPDLQNYPDFLENIGIISPFGYLILLAGSFILLIRSNYKLRHAIIQPVADSGNVKERDPDSNLTQHSNIEKSPFVNVMEDDNIQKAQEEK